MTDKIHILHVLNQLDFGGLEKGVIKIIQSLSDEFYHSILVLSGGNTLNINFNSENAQCVFLNKNPGPLCLYYKQLYVIFKKLRPSILHTRNFSTIECQLIGFLTKIPFRIHSEHGRDELDLESLERKKIIFRKTSKWFTHQYVALSNDLAHYLVTKIKVDKNKLKIIPNGVDTSLFRPKKIVPTTSTTLFVTVGRLEKIKNLHCLILAFAHVIKEIPSKLWIIGDGTERNRLEQLATELGVHKHVEFMGFCPQPQKWLAQADIYVQTSLYEGISNTILEAMACGLPVIASKVGGNHELIQHKINGYLFEPKDVKSLSVYMKILLRNETLRQEFGKVSQTEIRNRYTLEHMMDRYYSLYTHGLKKEKLCAVS